MSTFGTTFGLRLTAIAISFASIPLMAQSQPQAPKPNTSASHSATKEASKHSLFKRKPHSPAVSMTQPEATQPSDQAQTRAWLQDAASRVPAPDAATLREEMRQSEQLRLQHRDRVTPQSLQNRPLQNPQPNIRSVSISQIGEI